MSRPCTIILTAKKSIRLFAGIFFKKEKNHFMTHYLKVTMFFYIFLQLYNPAFPGVSLEKQQLYIANA